MPAIPSKPAPKSIPIQVYLAWVNAWLTSAQTQDHKPVKKILTLQELAQLIEEGDWEQFIDQDKLHLAAHSFRQHVKNGRISFGGSSPPSCDETNLVSENYNPESSCSCTGIFPLPKDADIHAILQQTNCSAVRKTLHAMRTVLGRKDEWNRSSLFSAEHLEKAVSELLLANSDVQPAADTCQGRHASGDIPAIQAPDRRPHPVNDTQAGVARRLYPMAEGVKFCVDAKYYVMMACSAGSCDDGIVHAIADAANDVFIGDYCEVADPETLKLLQQNGAAAVAFLKLCNMAGVVTDWQFDNLAVSLIIFRVLGYYRDHARPHIPGGIYGSRMTGILAHRYIDLSMFIGVMSASVTMGQILGEREYVRLNEACALISDMVDFRSDTKRKQRESVVLRGVRGSLCTYLDGLIVRCLDTVIEVIQTSRMGAVIMMALCNWAVMGSHHKIYELIEGTREVEHYQQCVYQSEADGARYEQLLHELAPFGTLEDGPRVSKKRASMDLMYSSCRLSEEKHLAWLADITRSLLEPSTMRRILDVVHFEWTGYEGDAEYCP